MSYSNFKKVGFMMMMISTDTEWSQMLHDANAMWKNLGMEDPKELPEENEEQGEAHQS